MIRSAASRGLTCRRRRSARTSNRSVAELLAAAAASPPDDTIIRVAVYSGLRRGEVFGLQWSDIDAGDGDGGRIHVRRSIYQGAITTPKTEDSDRVVDVPQRLLDDLAVYKVMHPPIGPGFVFRQEKGQPMDPDAWHRERLVPILKRVNLYHPGTGLHSIRHTYVSLLIAQGAERALLRGPGTAGLMAGLRLVHTRPYEVALDRDRGRTRHRSGFIRAAIRRAL